jgi:hypothetical protein
MDEPQGSALDAAIRSTSEMVRHLLERDRFSLVNWYRNRPATEQEIAALADRGTKTDVAEAPAWPGNVADLAKWAADVLALVPEEYRATAEMSPPDDGDSAVMYWARPETDEEWAARRADVERRQALPPQTFRVNPEL